MSCHIGPCKACKTEYEKKVIHRVKGYIPQRCPNCGYHPRLEEEIKSLIDRNAEFRLTVSRKMTEFAEIKVNSEELTDLIIKNLLPYWPKH